MGQDKRIWDWKDAAKVCLTPGVQKFRDLYLVSYFKVYFIRRINKLRKVERTGWILPSGRGLPYLRLKISLLELQSPPWFRSANLGFGCFASSGSSLGYFEFSLELMERDSWIALGFGISISSRIQSGGDVLLLCGLLPILNFVGSWILVKPDAVPSAFGGLSEQAIKW